MMNIMFRRFEAVDLPDAVGMLRAANGKRHFKGGSEWT
jgi:hypothetical protein